MPLEKVHCKSKNCGYYCSLSQGARAKNEGHWLCVFLGVSVYDVSYFVGFFIKN